MTRAPAVVAWCLVAMTGWACRGSQATTAGTLSDPCDAPVVQGVPVRVAGTAVGGRIRDVRELSAAPGRIRVGIVADSGLYVGTLHGDSIVIDRRIADWGSADGQVLRVDALSEGGDGSVVVFDWQLRRITRWTPSGTIDRSLTLRLSSLADDYVAGGGGIAAVTSRPGNRPYASTRGELHALDSLGYVDSLLASYPSLVVHLTNGARGSKFLRRPLERQPIIRWSHAHGWVIASTDSLNIHFGPRRQQRAITGTGARAPIDQQARDSSIDEYARNTGARGSELEEMRSFARDNLFRDRTRLQLVDDLVPMLDGGFAVSRMRLCRDRHGWNMIDSTGLATGVFTVPLPYRAVTATDGGMLFAVPQSDSLHLMLVPVVAHGARVAERAGKQ